MRTECDRNGFTLLEMMVTVIIVGIVAAIALPSYGKARERGYWRHAEQTLLTIYHGQRAHFLSSAAGTYCDVSTTNCCPQPACWRDGIYMDNPNLGSIPVTFAVTSNAPFTTFEATATRDGSRLMTIDHNRDWCRVPNNQDPEANCPTWPMP